MYLLLKKITHHQIRMQKVNKIQMRKNYLTAVTKQNKTALLHVNKNETYTLHTPQIITNIISVNNKKRTEKQICYETKTFPRLSPDVCCAGCSSCFKSSCPLILILCFSLYSFISSPFFPSCSFNFAINSVSFSLCVIKSGSTSLTLRSVKTPPIIRKHFLSSFTFFKVSITSLEKSEVMSLCRRHTWQFSLKLTCVRLDQPRILIISRPDCAVPPWAPGNRWGSPPGRAPLTMISCPTFEIHWPFLFCCSESVHSVKMSVKSELKQIFTVFLSVGYKKIWWKTWFWHWQFVMGKWLNEAKKSGVVISTKQ